MTKVAKKTSKKSTKKSESPKHTALSMEKRGQYWYVITYTIQDGIIVNEFVSEEMMRSEALNNFKILTARTFFNLSAIRPE